MNPATKRSFGHARRRPQPARNDTTPTQVQPVLGHVVTLDGFERLGMDQQSDQLKKQQARATSVLRGVATNVTASVFGTSIVLTPASVSTQPVYV